jgi:hypothetical protein
MLNALREQEGELAPKVAAVLVMLTTFLTMLVPFDFRGDLDRLAFLKTLPVPAVRLALGQVLTPVLVMTVIHCLILAAVLPFAPHSALELAVLAAYSPPFNFLLFALENLLFLLFPTRQLASPTPGDFQALGRNFLFFFVKMVGLVVTLTPAMVVGVLAWSLTRSLPAALAAAWPVVVLAGAALVPLVALAFHFFDVGRDTPA